MTWRQLLTIWSVPNWQNRRKDKKITLLVNGFQYNVSGAVGDFLAKEFASSRLNVKLISTPLFASDKRTIRIQRYVEGLKTKETFYWLPVNAPFSYVLDPLVTAIALKSQIAITFSPHFFLFAYFLKKIGLIKFVIHWSIDFSPRRFGFSFLEKIYRYLDAKAFLHSDLHVDISSYSLEMRRSMYESKNQFIESNHLIVPVGIPDESINPIPISNFSLKRVFFLGNLTDNVGIETFIEVAKIVCQHDPSTSFHIIGDGPRKNIAVDLVKQYEIGDNVTFYGALDRLDFETLLKTASLGLAPYRDSKNSFSRYADPSKIKNYMQFAIPFIMTNVPLISQDYREAGIGVIVPDSISALCSSTLSLLSKESLWLEQHKTAIEAAEDFTWSRVLGEFAKRLEGLIT